MSQMPVAMPNVVADAPASRQGETAARPRPEPSAISTSDTAAATNAPAMIAGHETAELADSTRSLATPEPKSGPAPRRAVVKAPAMLSFLASDQCQIKARR